MSATPRNAEQMDELRASILKRPGMYFGDLSRFGGFANLLGAMAIDAAQAGATAVSCRVHPDGRIEFSIVPSDTLAAEWSSSALGLEPTGGLYASSWGIAAAVSKRVERRESAERLGAIFEPDLDAFPYLDPTSLYPLVGVMNDLATAFPQYRVDADDEREGLRIALRFARGCADRLRLEGGERGVRHPFRFEGKHGDVTYDVALTWCSGPGLQVVSIVNGRRSANGGSHVQGVWEGVAAALNERLKAEGIASRELDLMDIPRNALLVVSVHLDNPGHGPATRDCLHDERAREAVRNAVATEFFAKLGDEATQSAKPPWQLLGGIHYDTPWLQRLPDELCGDCRPGDRDPFHHHSGDEH